MWHKYIHTNIHGTKILQNPLQHIQTKTILRTFDLKGEYILISALSNYRACVY